MLTCHSRVADNRSWVGTLPGPGANIRTEKSTLGSRLGRTPQRHVVSAATRYACQHVRHIKHPVDVIHGIQPPHARRLAAPSADRHPGPVSRSPGTNHDAPRHSDSPRCRRWFPHRPPYSRTARTLFQPLLAVSIRDTDHQRDRSEINPPNGREYRRCATAEGSPRSSTPRDYRSVRPVPWPCSQERLDHIEVHRAQLVTQLTHRPPVRRDDGVLELLNRWTLEEAEQ